MRAANLSRAAAVAPLPLVPVMCSASLIASLELAIETGRAAGHEVFELESLLLQLTVARFKAGSK